MIKGIDIGKMDVLLTIQSPTKTRHAVTGEEITAWADLMEMWAEKVVKPGSSESFEGEQQVSKTRSYFKIRWTDAITEDMRVTRGGVVEYITGIEETDRKKCLTLRTEKRDNE